MTRNGPTRDEFAMLADQVKGNATRLDNIDVSGTRGVAVLATQVGELTRDVAELRSEFSQHEQTHREAERARVAGRRWALGFAVAGLAALSAMIGLLVDISSAVHH